MRVLQIGSALYDWGGIERYVLYLAQGLHANGANVTVTCPDPSPLRERLGDIPSVGIGLRSRISIPAFVATYRALKDSNAQVMHAHYSPDFVVAGLAARYAKTPVRILTRHLATHWSRSKVDRILGLYDHIVPVSEATRQALIGCGVPPERATVALAGTPALHPTLDRQTVREELGLDDRFWVGSFGRLAPEKGVDVLIHALGQLPDRFAGAIFGGGDDRGRLEALAEPYGDRIRFFGFVPDVSNAMSAVDAIAITSTWAEAFPYSVLEAMSLGRPIVASNIGGIPEQVADEGEGLLFPAADPAALAARLMRIEGDPDLGRRLGFAAQRKQHEQFQVEHFVARMESLYRRLLAVKAA